MHLKVKGIELIWDETSCQAGYFRLLEFADEIILLVLSHLDIPDLSTLSLLSRHLRALSLDRVLHMHRLHSVPPKLNRWLSVGPPRGRIGRLEVVRMGIFKGLELERKWIREGGYVHTNLSVKQYEAAMKVARRTLASALQRSLQKRQSLSASSLSHLNLIDVELVSPSAHSSPLPPRRQLRDNSQSPQSHRSRVSWNLIPAMHLLKRAIAKDELSRNMRGGEGFRRFLSVMEGKGRGMWDEKDERVRLAVCPGVKSLVRDWEIMSSQVPSSPSSKRMNRQVTA